jgi:hypothetical protein
MRTGTWALVSLHLPGRSLEPVGIILSDDADQLHVKLRTDWSTMVDVGEIEICRELAADLEQKGRELGGTSVLDWLENTASHAIQIATRKTVQVADVSIAVQALYQQHVAEAERRDRANAAHKRYRVSVGLAAALFMAAVLGPQWNRFRASHPSSSKVSSYASFSPQLLSQLPQKHDVTLDAQSLLKPASGSPHRHRPRRITTHVHRVFQFQNIFLKAPLAQVVKIDAPPSDEVMQLNSASVLDFNLPEPPPFQVRHKRFIHFLAVVASSVKRLFSWQPVDQSILN